MYVEAKNKASAVKAVNWKTRNQGKFIPVTTLTQTTLAASKILNKMLFIIIIIFLPR